MDYSVYLLSQKHHFGFVEGPDEAIQFRLTTKILVNHSGVKERHEGLLRYNPPTIREIMTDASFELVN